MWAALQSRGHPAGEGRPVSSGGTTVPVPAQRLPAVSLSQNSQTPPQVPSAGVLPPGLLMVFLILAGTYLGHGVPRGPPFLPILSRQRPRDYNGQPLHPLWICCGISSQGRAFWGKRLSLLIRARDPPWGPEPAGGMDHRSRVLVSSELRCPLRCALWLLRHNKRTVPGVDLPRGPSSAAPGSRLCTPLSQRGGGFPRDRSLTPAWK